MVCETDGIKDAPDPVADLVAQPGVLLVGWPKCTLVASVGLLECGWGEGSGRGVPRRGLAEWTGACGRVTSNLPGGRAVR